MRRYVIEKQRGGADRELLQVCIVYPTEINRKRVRVENTPYSFEEKRLIFDKQKNKWRFDEL